ncbi:20208_t:CDS:1, partial [Gigaspora margarita]
SRFCGLNSLLSPKPKPPPPLEDSDYGPVEFHNILVAISLNK